MNEQINKDRELIESWQDHLIQDEDEDVNLINQLLAAQARVTQYEERQRVVEILETWGKCDTPVRLALITIQDEILEIPSNHH